jgi:alcohol dehydrogenase
MSDNKLGVFLTPSAVYHGAGALAQLRAIVERLGAERPVLVADPGVLQAGQSEGLGAALGALPPCYSDVQPEPPYHVAERCAAYLQEQRADLVIALGGGSTIDVAKMAAALTRNPGGVRDYLGVGKIRHPGLPLVAIPTTAGTGSEVSPAAVFVDPESGRKVGARSEFLMPTVAILDPVLTLTLPQTITASTGIDALTHAIECYTARASTLIGDTAAERAIGLIAAHLPVAYADGQNLAAREGQLLGSYFAGLALSVANVGAVHALAQALGGLYGVPHGVANALFLPYVMAFNRIGCGIKYARVAELLGQPIAGRSLDDAALAAVEAVRDLTQALGIPQTIRALGREIPHAALPDIAERCLETQGRIIANNPRSLSLDECRQLLEQAY